jgi:hypothetical protein
MGSADSKGKDRWDKLEVLVPLIQMVALGLAAYFLTDPIANHFKERELQISGATEMRELLVNLLSVKPEDAARAPGIAAALAPFGEPAIRPLVNVMQHGEGYQRDAAENGLLAIAMTDSGAVALQMLQIIRNRTHLYAWRTHWSAIHILGQMGCTQALPDLRTYAGLLNQEPAAALANLNAMVQENPSPGINGLAAMKDMVRSTLKSLGEPVEAQP